MHRGHKSTSRALKMSSDGLLRWSNRCVCVCMCVCLCWSKCKSIMTGTKFMLHWCAKGLCILTIVTEVSILMKQASKPGQHCLSLKHDPRPGHSGICLPLPVNTAWVWCSATGQMWGKLDGLWVALASAMTLSQFTLQECAEGWKQGRSSCCSNALQYRLVHSFPVTPWSKWAFCRTQNASLDNTASPWNTIRGLDAGGESLPWPVKTAWVGVSATGLMGAQSLAAAMRYSTGLCIVRKFNLWSKWAFCWAQKANLDNATSPWNTFWGLDTWGICPMIQNFIQIGKVKIQITKVKIAWPWLFRWKWMKAEIKQQNIIRTYCKRKLTQKNIVSKEFTTKLNRKRIISWTGIWKEIKRQKHSLQGSQQEIQRKTIV